MNKSPLDILTHLVTAPERLIAGIMSGTSVDAIDVALVKIRGSGEHLELELVHYTETLFAEEMQQRIFANAEVSSSNVNDICLLHTALAHVYSDALRATCMEAGIDPCSLHLVGMHGQTIRHLPNAMDLAGLSIRSSLQIGSATTLAALSGIPVVYDFRSGDLALGGQGAPLVPRADWIVFRSDEEHRMILNLGGIANVTILPRACRPEEVIAFDTGPGNMVLDALMRHFYGREFDEDGVIASSGVVNPDLLGWMLGHPYFKQHIPKSTGREQFGEDYLNNMLLLARDLGIDEASDIVATAAECTVRSIYAQVQPLLPDASSYRLLLAGGGAKNRFFSEGLRLSFSGASVESTASLGIPPEAREAVCFAVLANEWLVGNPGNLPSATGADREALLGALALPA